MLMKKNEGEMDRGVRLLLGIGLMAGGLWVGGTFGWVLGAVGVVPLVTGLTGWCPLYSLFNINTCPLKKI